MFRSSTLEDLGLLELVDYSVASPAFNLDHQQPG